MKSILLLLTMFLLTACTSFHVIEKSPAVIQHQIQQGTLINIGDKVKIIDVNGQAHNFKVRNLTKTNISGADTNIAIQDIAALEVKELSAGKSISTIPVTIGVVALLGYLLN